MENHDWSFRDELIVLLRRWHLFAAVLLIGMAAGWAFGLLRPAQYEVVADLKVGFNSDAIYLTPDDYKNWQMEALEDLALSDRVLNHTLTRLQSDSTGWSTWTVETIAEVIAPRWRNAGRWNLAAVMPEADQAEDVVRAWRSAVQEEASEALLHAEAFNRLDRRLNEVARQLAAQDETLARLNAITKDLDVLANTDPLDRAQIERLASELRVRMELHLDLHKDVFLAFPGAAAESEAYLIWAQAAKAEVAETRKAVDAAHGELLAMYDVMHTDWLAEKNASQGLSAYLTVQMPTRTDVRVERQYWQGEFAISGGLIAVLLWLVISLLRVNTRIKGADVG